MDKEDVVYICAYIYIYTQTHGDTQWNITQPQKNEILPFVATLMDLEGIMLTEQM